MIYHIATNLNHDKRAYARGEEIELPEEVAAHLIEGGVIQTEPVHDVEAPKNRDLVVAKSETPAKPEPAVGGETTVTGEPAIDNDADATARTPAEDITPAAEEQKDLSADL